MQRQHSDRTPARSQRASTDAPQPKKRERYRIFGFVRQNKNLTEADAGQLKNTLSTSSAAEWAFAPHGADTGCVNCAGTEKQLQGLMRFDEVRDLHVVEAMLPGYKVVPLVGATAWRRYAKYLPHGSEHEVTASFDFEVFLAKYGGTPVKSLLYRDIKRMVYEGDMTLLEVHRDHREVYINHWRSLRSLAEEGEEMREAERKVQRAKAEATRRELDRQHERYMESIESEIEEAVATQAHEELHARGEECERAGCPRNWELQMDLQIRQAESHDREVWL